MQMRFDVMACFRARIGDSRKLNARQAQIFRSMVLAKRSGPHDGRAQRSLRRKLMQVQESKPMLRMRIHQEFNAGKGA
jgi:hypothetical protein